MDSLTYNYNKGKNQLRQVLDAVPAGNYPNDIDNEPDPNNYKYNAIGELAKDSARGLDTITWTVYGKVKEVKKTNGDSILFVYDPLGNRLEKKVYPHSSTADTTTYTRDAQDMNMQCIFMESINNRRNDTVHLNEWDIYGSKRLGSVDTTMRIYPLPAKHNGGTLDSATVVYLENQKQYELSNHLGNVMVTVSDKKIPVDTNHDGLADYYMPNIVSAQDYYPYGMVQPGRVYAILGYSAYRFGFNGKLYDNELYGSKNSYDYGMRFYDPRLGRFMSVDPLARKYAYYSPYMFAGDNPIWATDLDGKEPVFTTHGYTQPADNTRGLPLPQKITPTSGVSSMHGFLNLLRYIDNMVPGLQIFGYGGKSNGTLHPASKRKIIATADYKALAELWSTITLGMGDPTEPPNPAEIAHKAMEAATDKKVNAHLGTKNSPLSGNQSGNAGGTNKNSPAQYIVFTKSAYNPNTSSGQPIDTNTQFGKKVYEAALKAMKGENKGIVKYSIHKIREEK